MTVAIMQPYVFPYIGYFQLMTQVDTFILYDDVNFINRGWINRNNILVNGKATLFTIPMREASQNKLIREIDVLPDSNWKVKFLRTLEMSYKKAPYFEPVYNMVISIISGYEGSVAGLAHRSIVCIREYIGITVNIVPTSVIYRNQHLKGQERIIDICRQEQAKQYINPLGGRDLYDTAYFAKANIELNFLQPTSVSYRQFGAEFVPWLSILDVLMFNDVSSIKSMLHGGKTV